MRVFDTGRKTQEFSTLALAPDGRWVAAGGRHESAVWDVTTDAAPLELFSTARHAFLADGRIVYTVGKSVEAFDPVARTVVPIWTGGRYLQSFTVDPGRAWLVCSHSREDNTPELIAVEQPGQPGQRNVWSIGLGDEDGEQGYAESLECLGDGERFLSAERLTVVGSWKRRRRVAIRSRTDGRLLAGTPQVYSYGDRVFASPASEVFVVLTASRIRVHRVDDPANCSHEVKNDGRKYFTAAAFHPSGQFMMAASNDATVKLYDTRSWAVARTFTWEIGRMRSVAFSADGTLAAAGSDSGKVVVWDVDV